jgi:hypothetical protein
MLLLVKEGVRGNYVSPKGTLFPTGSILPTDGWLLEGSLLNKYYYYTMTNNIDKANEELSVELNKSNRVNQYAQQDDIMLIYMQKILTILYAIIYIIMVYVMYVNPNVSRFYFGSMVLLFFLVPFAFWLVGKYFSDALLKTVKLFIKGNANYLYV